MNQETPPPSEAQLQAEAKRLARAADFKAVFGLKAFRTEAQTRVLEYLDSFGSDDQNSFEFNQPGDGLKTIAAGIHRDGAKSIIRVIHRNLSYAEKPKPTPKPKAQSQR